MKTHISEWSSSKDTFKNKKTLQKPSIIKLKVDIVKETAQNYSQKIKLKT
jgi:hypothetical protein